jgi:hypothetical protein
MKKSIAAKNYWFNYTAKRRYEEQMRRDQMTIQKKFSHALTKQYAHMMNFFVRLWYAIQWYINKLFKKVA